jgi:predicted dehydrogenase
MSSTGNTPTPINLAIIGYSLSAKVFHIPLIHAVPSLHIAAVVQRHPTPDNDAGVDLPGVKTYRSAAEMLQDDQEQRSLHAVVVTTPPDTHFELAREVLLSGRHGTYVFFLSFFLSFFLFFLGRGERRGRGV